MAPLLSQGAALQQAGRFAEAAEVYRRILAVHPNHADALHLLGVVYSQAGKYEEACDLIGRAIAIWPQNPSYHRNLGTAFRYRGLTDQAIAAWQRALALKPNTPDLLNSLGTALQEKGQMDEALVCFRRAISFSPEYAHAHYNLGCLYEQKREFDKAIASYQKVLELKPTYAEAYNNLGRIWKDRGRLDDSISSYRKAIAVRPDFLDARQNLLFVQLYHPDSTNESIRKELREWNELFAKPLAAKVRPHPNNRDPERKLRLGYISGDFRAHVVARFYISHLLGLRHRENFEVTCYAQVPVHDAMTMQFREQSDHWHTIFGMTDEQVADQVRTDQIDILLDLALHTTGNRLLVFAQKPAPLQMTLAGYPGSTGLETIDYRLTDPYLDPPGMNDEYYSEQSVRMPETFWALADLEQEPTVGGLPALTKGYVTFGQLNNFCKINDQLLEQWARILDRVKDSHLLLLAPEGEPRERVDTFFQQRNIDPDRIEFAGMQSRSAYLATYNRIDIGLDTWPYNGHSTSLDSFWMGVPIVTWVGPTVVGRAGVSQLRNLDLPDLIGETADDYVNIAVQLANDLPRLAQHRSTFRERVRSSPLMNPQKFVRGIEAIYREKWRVWCGRSPE